MFDAIAMPFQLESEFSLPETNPKRLNNWSMVSTGRRNSHLQGVTGSGKTFTVANVVKELQRPTLVLAHNKTLAAQLYSEFKQFFPNNAVEYFVSYYDYYQPEAYIPVTGTYIEKDLSINEEIEKLRLSTTSSSSQDDAMSWWSPRCSVYTDWKPRRVPKNVITLEQDQVISRTKLLHRLVQSLYSRTTADFNHGNFRVKGDVVDIYPSYADTAFRVHFLGMKLKK